ncbi:hypothetical protein HN695_03990 [Candidatus Woesearchaeota archaeon]|jgi:hypothetical protein|nr:hypothetical protein [Candidatus Woesearchaeota archaeon]MBT5272310.1 hypothetical protein [Candidatus Woesearchaeota archaeon]MBT6040639.1 hypothetical protein [Candidatus Woesearchaeota archaeon]MBT6336582.1 hypothetical protein [Candidatus Woesearchaeota archaeon]MBT7927472.1 hypothetical protein [Candidatus Woesearchaeota archaeon]
MIKIIKSRTLLDKSTQLDWSSIVATILSTSKTLVVSKRFGKIETQLPKKVVYFKIFPKFTLEVSTMQYEKSLYVMGVNKNVQLNLSTMCN